MHKPITIVAAALTAWLGCSTIARAQCVPAVGPDGQVQTYCDDFRPLRIATAVTNGPPLIWSSEAGTLVPPPVYGRPRLIGHTIPIEALIGRKVVPLTGLPRAVVFNSPESFPGAADPGVVLMPVRPVRVVIRERHLRTRGVLGLGRAEIISVKD